jgi:hypothetical protein
MSYKTYFPAFAAVLMLANACAETQDRGASRQASTTGASSMKLSITIDGQTVTATLADSAASCAFAAQLPLRLTLNDYAATEKVADLPQRLDPAGSPAGYAPRAGDIAWYAPWGNIALFHKDFAYSRGLIHLGRFDAGVELLKRPGPVQATIALQDEAARR